MKQSTFIGLNPFYIHNQNELYPNTVVPLTTTYSSINSVNGLIVLSGVTPTLGFNVGDRVRINGLIITTIKSLFGSDVTLNLFSNVIISPTGTMTKWLDNYYDRYTIIVGEDNPYYSPYKPTKSFTKILTPNVKNITSLNIVPYAQTYFKIDNKAPFYIGSMFKEINLCNKVVGSVSGYLDETITETLDISSEPIYVVNGYGDYNYYAVTKDEDNDSLNKFEKGRFLNINKKIYNEDSFTFNFLIDFDLEAGEVIQIFIKNESRDESYVEDLVISERGYYRFKLNIESFLVQNPILVPSDFFYAELVLVDTVNLVSLVLIEDTKFENNISNEYRVTPSNNCTPTIVDASSNNIISFSNILVEYLSSIGSWEQLMFDAYTDKSIEMEVLNTAHNNRFIDIFSENNDYDRYHTKKKGVKKGKLRTSMLDKDLAYTIGEDLAKTIKCFRLNNDGTKTLLLLEGDSFEVKGKDKSMAIEIDYEESNIVYSQSGV